MKILFDRIRKQGRYNAKLWHSIADWTTWLYIVIPTGLFLFFLYKETLLKNSFELIIHLPVSVIVFCLLAILSLGSIRTFTESADRLFFIQHPHYTNLKYGALCYSLGTKTILATVVILLLQPLWINLYELASWQSLQLILLVLISFVVNTLLTFHGKLSHFIGTFTTLISLTWLFVNFTGFWSWFVYLLLFAIVVWFYVTKYIGSIRAFEKQLAVDLQQFYNLQSIIFRISLELNSTMPVHTKQKRPRLFYQKQLVVNPATDLLLKTMVRHKQYRLGYLQLLGLQLSIYIFAVWWVDFIVFILVYFILKNWLHSVIRQIQQQPIFIIFKVSEEQWFIATNELKRYLIHTVMFIVFVTLVLVNLLQFY